MLNRCHQPGDLLKEGLEQCSPGRRQNPSANHRAPARPVFAGRGHYPPGISNLAGQRGAVKNPPRPAPLPPLKTAASADVNVRDTAPSSLKASRSASLQIYRVHRDAAPHCLVGSGTQLPLKPRLPHLPTRPPGAIFIYVPSSRRPCAPAWAGPVGDSARLQDSNANSPTCLRDRLSGSPWAPSSRRRPDLQSIAPHPSSRATLAAKLSSHQRAHSLRRHLDLMCDRCCHQCYAPALRTSSPRTAAAKCPIWSCGPPRPAPMLTLSPTVRVPVPPTLLYDRTNDLGGPRAHLCAAQAAAGAIGLELPSHQSLHRRALTGACAADGEAYWTLAGKWRPCAGALSRPHSSCPAAAPHQPRLGQAMEISCAGEAARASLSTGKTRTARPIGRLVVAHFIAAACRALRPLASRRLRALRSAPPSRPAGEPHADRRWLNTPSAASSNRCTRAPGRGRRPGPPCCLLAIRPGHFPAPIAKPSSTCRYESARPRLCPDPREIASPAAPPLAPE